MVVPRTKEAKILGFDAGRGRRRFGKKSALFVSSEAEAQEIDTTVGLKGSKDVWVHEDPMYEWHLHNDGSTNGQNIDTHHYTFGASRRYANAWEAFERRRKDKK